MKHDGKSCPVEPEAAVHVRYACGRFAGQMERDGIKSQPILARERVWDWKKRNREPQPFDIVAYWRAEWAEGRQ